MSERMKSDFELFSEALKYFPETGVFRWKISRSNNVPAGSVAGSINARGYWQIEYLGRKYRAHRLAWLLMVGTWPKKEIDHRNRITSDNRWENLRQATHSQNQANCKGWGKYPKGVRLHCDGKFEARIQKDGKPHNLGYFHTPEEASAAYAVAANKYFGEYARLN